MQCNWSDQCKTAFTMLKEKLVQASIISYPQFDKKSPALTHTSSVSIGAILEQGKHIIGYASRSLNKAEQQYSVTQYEYLAIYSILNEAVLTLLSG